LDPIKPQQVDAQDVSDKLKFVRKVYSILAMQLTLTAAFVVIS
jgi:FtsH-binding integral membrane protein